MRRQTGRIHLVEVDGSEVQRSALSCSLQSFISTTEARFSVLSVGTSTQVGRLSEACRLGALLKVSHTILNRGYMRLADAVELYHFTLVKLNDDCGIGDDMRHTVCHRLRMQLVVHLPIMKVPFRFSGSAGVAAFVIIPNVPSVHDRDLHLHLNPVMQLLHNCNNKAAAGSALQAKDVRLLKDSMPAFVSPLVDWLIVKAGFGAEINRHLGISYARAEHVNHRFNLLCDVELPKLQLEAEARALEQLAAKSGQSLEKVRAVTASATRRQLRQLVGKRGVFIDTRHSARRALAVLHPDLLEVVREIVRTNASDDILYKKRDTPVDALLMLNVSGIGGA